MSELALEQPKTKRITSADICAALSRRYAHPEWAIFFEVRDAAGFNARRSADAVAMSLWPSRGLELHGFEVKVSRSDWRNEAKQPEKAEAIGAYCDRWWVVAPPGVVPDEELPPAWGHLTWDGKKWAVRKASEKTEAKPVTRQFLAAVLRRAKQADDVEIAALVEAKDADRREKFEAEVEQRIRWRTNEYINLKEAVTAFEKTAGVSITDWRSGEVGKAVRLILGSGYETIPQAAKRLAEAHKSAAEQLDKALLAFTPESQTNTEKS